jgi:outer membrane protein OmpA-like peptidoglycan-associated protein
MSKYLGNLRLKVASAVIVTGLVLSVGVASAEEQPSTDQILKSLTPAPLTRSLSISQPEAAKIAEERRFLNGLLNRTTRSLSTGEREQLATIADNKPKRDLEINFGFNTDRIAHSALPTVKALANALADPTIRGSTFLVAGHTDGKGSPEYNQILSERRADAVKRMLVNKYGIAADSLVTVGYGKTHLKNSSNPLAAENRRVAIVNLADGKAAGN